MSANRRNRTKVSVSVLSLDERIAPTTMNGLAALIQARRLNPALMANGGLARAGSTQAGQARLARNQASNGQVSVTVPPRRAAALARQARLAALRGAVAATPPPVAPAPAPAPTPVAVATETPLPNMDAATSAKAGPMLSQLYQEYQAFVSSGGTGTFASGLASQIRIVGNSVGVDVQSSGDFNGLVTSLQGLGMQVESANAGYNMVEGLLPIDQIPAATSLPQAGSITPIYRPMLR